MTNKSAGAEERYSRTWWQIDDVRARRPDWTDDQCHDFLYRHEETIQESMIIAGWKTIDTLLAREQDDENVQIPAPGAEVS